jgi:integrase
VRLPYVHTFRDRHGKVRHYFRRPGYKRIALPGAPSSTEFKAAYAAALSGHKLEIGEGRSLSGTVTAAIAAYYQDASFRALAPATQKMRRAILERWRERDGDKRLATLEPKHIALMLGRMKPFAARNWLKTLRGLMEFAVRTRLRRDDPTRAFKPVKVRPGTFHTWTEDEIAQYERHHAVGTRARLAMALLLYTAARRGDMVRLGPQHVRAGRISYRQQKTGRALAIPLHPSLADELSHHPAEHLTFLTTARGAPFSAAGFGNMFRRWCNEAGLPHCSAHGLRKAQARRLAEAGCSAHEIASITGHRTLAEVQRYADAADQARLAERAIDKTRK